uniref:Uncharacterized protein n=1 Tax=Pyrodinium bahamense TaxID=73915 RepID=A0A7S0FAU8_9DINO
MSASVSSSARPFPVPRALGASAESLGEGGREPWSPKLQSRVGAPVPQPDRPEWLRIRSTSHTGRLLRHQRHWVPDQCRPPLPPPPPKRRGVGDEEQLIYLALYRDKVAKQQAELAAQALEATAAVTRSSCSSSRRRADRNSMAPVQRSNIGSIGGPPARAAPQVGMPPPTLGTTAAAVAATASATSADVAVIVAPAVTPGGAATDLEADATEAMVATAETLPHGVFLPQVPEPRASPHGDGMLRRRHTPQSSPFAGRSQDGEVEGRTSAHIASVSVRAAYGGVISEHLESKHLGQLFDQWRAHQVELNGGESPAGSGAGAGTGSSAPTRSRWGRPSGGGALAASAPPAPHRGLTQPMAAAAATAPAAVGASRSPVVSSSPRGGATTARSGVGRGSGASSSPQSPHHSSGADTAPAVVIAGGEVEGQAATTGDVESAPSGAGDQGGVWSGGEHRRTARLFNVITNSKVRCESFAERGYSDLLARPAPTHIEGFPPLQLSRLHRGPWRLNF